MPYACTRTYEQLLLVYRALVMLPQLVSKVVNLYFSHNRSMAGCSNRLKTDHRFYYLATYCIMLYVCYSLLMRNTCLGPCVGGSNNGWERLWDEHTVAYCCQLPCCYNK